MPIDGAAVRKIARLARLDLDASKLETFRHQFESILDYVAVLEQVEVESGGLDSTRSGGERELRADEPERSLHVHQALDNAPDSGDGHFKVPRIITK